MSPARGPGRIPGRLAPIAGGASAARRGAPANTVVVLSDDRRADFTGHPFVETPSLDRLAREGVRFSNAFVTSALPMKAAR